MTDKAPDAMPERYTPYPGWQIIIDQQGTMHHTPTFEYVTALLKLAEDMAKELDFHREIEMVPVGGAITCCGNVKDNGECRSICALEGPTDYEPQLMPGPVNEILAAYEQFMKGDKDE